MPADLTAIGRQIVEREDTVPPPTKAAAQHRDYVTGKMMDMKDGEIFILTNSRIARDTFILYAKEIMDSKVFYPRDFSFNDDYTVIKCIG